MLKTTASTSGGAMPEGLSKKPDRLNIGDELEKIRELIDVAYMAAGDLQDYQRGAMRGLLDQTSDKIAEIVEAYCGRNLSLDEVADILTRKAAPEPTAEKADPIAARRDRIRESVRDDIVLGRDLIGVSDDVTQAKYLVDAAMMAADHLDLEAKNAMQSVIAVALDKIEAAQDRLNAVLGAEQERKAA